MEGEVSSMTVEECCVLQTIKERLELILNRLDIKKSFDIRIHRHKTYTIDNKIIYLKLGCNGSIYDIDTLMKTGIHELTHVLNMSIHSNRTHDSQFVKLETIIEITAIILDLYDPTKLLMYEEKCPY